MQTLKEEKNRSCINLRVIEGKFEAQAAEMFELKTEKTQREKEYIESLKTNIASVTQKIEEKLKIKETYMQKLQVELEQIKDKLSGNEKSMKTANANCVTCYENEAKIIELKQRLLRSRENPQ